MSSFAKSKLVDSLSRVIMKLPGIGPRSSRKLAFFLLSNKEKILKDMIDTMKLVYDNIKICDMCGNFTQDKFCEICSNNRDAKILCLVRDHTDLYSIESTRAYNGLYYILGSNFSPSSPNSTEIINKIRDRAINDKVEEVMLAFNPSIEGRMLLHYLSASLNDLSLKVTHLGLGIPIGADFDYMDKETMTAAIVCRRQV